MRTEQEIRDRIKEIDVVLKYMEENKSYEGFPFYHTKKYELLWVLEGNTGESTEKETTNVQ